MPKITAYFESAVDTPMTAPTTAPRIRIRREDTQVLVVTDASMTEIGDGLYRYDFAEDAALEYTFRCDGDPLAAGQTSTGGRYTNGSFSGVTEARLETDIPAILVDTGTTIPAQITALNDPTAAAIADAVLTELVSDHEGTAGSLAAVVRESTYNGAVHVDFVDGTAGTAAGVGTAETPSDNLTDALSIAAARGSKMLIFSGVGSLSINATNATALTGFELITTQVRSFSASGTPSLSNVVFTGQWSGFLSSSFSMNTCFFVDCFLIFASGVVFTGCYLTRCQVSGTLDRTGGTAGNRFITCFGDDVFPLNLTSDGTGAWGQHFSNWSGTLNINSVTGTGLHVFVDLLGGVVNVPSSNTSPTSITVTGIGTLQGDEAANVNDFRVQTFNTDQEIRDALKLAPTAGAPAAGSVDEHLDDILTDTGTTIPGLIAALNDPTAAVIASEVWNALRSAHTTAGSMGNSFKLLLDGMIARKLIDTTPDPWQRVDYVFDEVAGNDTVVAERYDLYDQDGNAINGTPTTGNNPLNNSNVLLAEERRV